MLLLNLNIYHGFAAEVSSIFGPILLVFAVIMLRRLSKKKYDVDKDKSKEYSFVEKDVLGMDKPQIAELEDDKSNKKGKAISWQVIILVLLILFSFALIYDSARDMINDDSASGINNMEIRQGE